MTPVRKIVSNPGRERSRERSRSRDDSGWFAFLLSWNHRCPAQSAYLNATTRASLPACRALTGPFKVLWCRHDKSTRSWSHPDLYVPRCHKTLEMGKQDCISLQIWQPQTENNVYLKNNNLPSGHWCINTGLGVVLLQDQENVKHPVIYLSRKSLPRERNLSSI